MNRFYRNTFRDLARHFCLYLLLILAMMIIAQSIRLSDLWVLFGISWENIFKPIAYMLTPHLPFAMTLALFLATLTTYHHQSEEGAYPALIVAGCSWLRSWMPAWHAAALISVASYGITHHLEHHARSHFQEYRQEQAYKKLEQILKSKLTPQTFLDTFSGYMFRAEQVSADKNLFGQIFITQHPAPQTTALFSVTAPRAVLEYNQTPRTMNLTLFSGTLIGVSPTHSWHSYATFKEWRIDILKLFENQLFGKQHHSTQLKLSSPRKLRQTLTTTEDPEQRKQIQRRLASQAAIPCAPWLFILFALSLGIHASRSLKITLYLKALIIWMGYIIAAIAFPSLPLIPPLWGAWLPPIIFSLIGLYALRRRITTPLAEKIPLL